VTAIARLVRLQAEPPRNKMSKVASGFFRMFGVHAGGAGNGAAAIKGYAG
jgi:hypothetical protein